MLLTGAACHEAGLALDAEAWFRAVLERQPTNGVARVGVIEALLSQRRFAEAAAEAAQEASDSPLATVVASSALFAQAVLGDADALDAAINGAEAAGVAAHDIALYRAWLGALVGNPLPAALPAEAAPTLLTALEALLRVQEFDAFELGARLLERVQLDPRERREHLARMYLRRGFLESAADEWVAVAQERPDAQAYVGLAQVAFARGLADDTVAFLEAALELEPQNPDAGRMLAGVQQLAA
jgi:tetratricopeptide (TPR) repeat protein